MTGVELRTSGSKKINNLATDYEQMVSIKSSIPFVFLLLVEQG